MTSPPQFKDLVKAVQAFIPAGTLPLPDNLIDIIEGYVRKHEDRLEDSIADKVNEELLSIFHNTVANSPSRYAPFVAILRRLRPLISQPDKVLRWTDLLLPILDHLTQEKDLASESQTIVIDILTAEEGDAVGPAGGVSAILADKLLYVWLAGRKDAGQSEDPGQSFKEKHIRETLLQYGRKRPKDLMIVMDKYFVRMSCRARILLLAAEFVKSQPPHLYTILQTPLFGNILTCLQQDTSSTVISLALGVLTMILPHIPSSLVPHLPVLFNIYARLLFWDRLLSDADTKPDTTQDQRSPQGSETWEKCRFSPHFDGTSIQHLMTYYTVMYGLYPINFTDYIRKPQRYLRHADALDAEEVEIQPSEIRYATERFRQCHLLHENFYTLTIESEKTDFGRWIKSEPAEVVADCIALCVAPEWRPEGVVLDPIVEVPMVETVDLQEDHEETLLGGSFHPRTSISGSARAESIKSVRAHDADIDAESEAFPATVRKSSQASHHSARGEPTKSSSIDDTDSPALPKQLTTSGSQTRLQDMINSNKAIKSGIHQSLRNDSVPSLALSQHESISERLQGHLGSGLASAATTNEQKEAHESSIGHLYRQIMLLQNDLAFERFMKQQHLSHMGELRRRQLREATTEAEAQNLMITNRHLKQRLTEAKSTEMQVKKEAERSRTMSKKWEADLTAKLRILREEQKKWTEREKSLVSELESVKREHAKLVQLVCDAEVRELGLKQNMQSVELNVGELERLRKEVEKATEAERDFQAREAERQAAITGAQEAESRIEAMRMKVAALELELQQNHQRHQAQIAALNGRLQETLEKGVDPQIENLRPKLEAAIAGARAHQEQFRERLIEYAKRNHALQTELLDLKSSLPVRTRSAPLRPFDKRRLKYASSESEDIPQVRVRRGNSDPEIYDSASHNDTPPLEPVKSSTSTSSREGGPLVDVVPERLEPVVPGRSNSRGGTQNTRRDKKDKKDDRDRRKLVGIRGIRGFV